MPKDRRFVNPLTQSTETLPATETSTESETLPSTSTITYTSTLPQAKHRKRGNQAFEKTHERITLWLDSQLKQRFEALAYGQGVAKSTLLDEAISDGTQNKERKRQQAQRLVPDRLNDLREFLHRHRFKLRRPLSFRRVGNYLLVCHPIKPARC